MIELKNENACLLMWKTWTGIMFQDITTLLLVPKAFKDTIDLFVERYKDQNIDVIAGRFCRFSLSSSSSSSSLF